MGTVMLTVGGIAGAILGPSKVGGATTFFSTATEFTNDSTDTPTKEVIVAQNKIDPENTWKATIHQGENWQPVITRFLDSVIKVVKKSSVKDYQTPILLGVQSRAGLPDRDIVYAMARALGSKIEDNGEPLPPGVNAEGMLISVPLMHLQNKGFENGKKCLI